jgi:cell division septal protein FtsQ
MAFLRRASARGRTPVRALSGRALLIRAAVWGGAVAVAVLVVVLSQYLLGRVFFSHNPHFVIREIEVVPATKNLDPAFVANKLEVRPGDNLFAVDPGAIRAGLRRDPIIQEAEVARILPDKLQVTVYGRLPVARLPRAGGTLLVDADGYVMPPSAHGERLNRPLVGGLAGLPQAATGQRLESPELACALQFINLRATLEHGRWLEPQHLSCNPQDNELTVYLRGRPDVGILPGARLILPLRNLEPALRRALAVVEVRALAHQPIGQINATYQRVPVLAAVP